MALNADRIRRLAAEMDDEVVPEMTREQAEKVARLLKAPRARVAAAG